MRRFARYHIIKEDPEFWENFFESNPVILARGPVGGTGGDVKDLLFIVNRGFYLRINGKMEKKFSLLEDAIKGYNNYVK